MDEKGAGAAPSPSPQSRPQKIKRTEQCFHGVACTYVVLERSVCVCVSLCVLCNIKQPQHLHGVPRELMMCRHIL